MHAKAIYLFILLLLCACAPAATPTERPAATSSTDLPSAILERATSTWTPAIFPPDTLTPSNTARPAATPKPSRTPRPTATATETEPPTATPTPTPLVLSPEEASSVRPEDVLEEILVAGGAGGYGRCWQDDPPPPHVELVSYPGTGDYELLTPVEIKSCGWQAGEQVSIRVLYPDGRELLDDKTSIAAGEESYGGFNFTFMPTLDDPPGDYAFFFSGSSGESGMSIHFSGPEGAHLYWLGDGRLMLHAFAPNEAVRLFVYDWADFLAWQEVQVGADGRLDMFTTYTDKRLAAVGDQSGESEVINLNQGSVNHSEVKERWPSECSIILHPCRNTLAQRLVCRRYTSVCGGSDPAIIYSKPNLSGVPIGSLAMGESVYVTGGPVCNNHMSWWKIEFRSDEGWMTGWVSEGSRADGYFLCPSE